jgi:hypothetical protein
VAKKKAEKFISTRKQDSTRLHKVSDVHQNSLCFEILLCFMTKYVSGFTGGMLGLGTLFLIQRETSRMSGPRTPLQAAAAAGCRVETDSCGKTEGGEIHQHA